jgi:hypothetical protein
MSSLIARRLSSLLAVPATAVGGAPRSSVGLKAILTFVEGQWRGESILVSQDRLVIGRDEDCDVSFPSDARLSREHAVLFRNHANDGAWHCASLGMAAGEYTWVNNRPVGANPVLVPPGAVVRLGQQAFRIDYNAATPAVAPTAAFDSWVPPGAPVTVQGILLPGGMIYVGTDLPKLRGTGVEPALIDPRLKIATKAPSPQLYGYYWYSNYWSSYSALTPGRRRAYLEWLAGGRSDPNADEGCAFLFFYGLERRLLADTGQNDVPGPEERAALRAELERLIALYGGRMNLLPNYAAQLINYLDVRALLATDTLPPADALLAHTRAWKLPLSLEVVLARFAQTKAPLPADYALAWYRLSPDTAPRTAALRCPDEMRALFAHRYAARFAKDGGVRVSATKTALDIAYQPASDTFGSGSALIRPWTTNTRGAKETAALPRRVSRAALNRIAEVAAGCEGALDAFSRAVARDPDGARRTFPALAHLPDPLFADHPAVAALRDRLQIALQNERVALVPARDLLAAWRSPAVENDANDATATAPPLTKTEATLLAQTLERLGFLFEPDARFGGAPFDPAGTVALARDITPRPPTSVPLPSAALPLVALLAQVITAAAEKPEGGGNLRLPGLNLANMIAHLPHAETRDRTRLAVRLRWLLANPGKIRAPRKLATPALSDAEQIEFADLLVTVALAGSNGSAGPRVVKALARAFAAIGLDETQVYARVHQHATSITRRSNNGDGLSTVAPCSSRHARLRTSPAAHVRRFDRSSETPGRRSRRQTSTESVLIDPAVVERTLRESEQVSALLADIFADEEGLR